MVSFDDGLQTLRDVAGQIREQECRSAVEILLPWRRLRDGDRSVFQVSLREYDAEGQEDSAIIEATHGGPVNVMIIFGDACCLSSILALAGLLEARYHR